VDSPPGIGTKRVHKENLFISPTTHRIWVSISLDIGD
jgi:hypothetical protein